LFYTSTHTNLAIKIQRVKPIEQPEYAGYDPWAMALFGDGPTTYDTLLQTNACCSKGAALRELEDMVRDEMKRLKKEEMQNEMARDYKWKRLYVHEES
jgi:hypothetical protein